MKAERQKLIFYYLITYGYRIALEENHKIISINRELFIQFHRYSFIVNPLFYSIIVFLSFIIMYAIIIFYLLICSKKGKQFIDSEIRVSCRRPYTRKKTHQIYKTLQAR